MQIEPNPPNVNTSAPIDLAKVHSPAEFENSEAIKLVVQDEATTSAWIANEQWRVLWREADILYQSPRSLATWEGTGVPRANIVRFLVASHVNSILAPLMSGLFYENPPFMLQPYPGTTEDTTRAIQEVQGAQLKAMGFREQVRRGLFSALLFGTAIWKGGWFAETKIVKKFRPKTPPLTFENAAGAETTISSVESDELEVEEIEKLDARPCLHARDIRHLLVSRELAVPDIREAKFVIDRMAVTYRDLVKMKEDAKLLGIEYDIPSEKEVKEWFEPPAEQSAQPSGPEQTDQSNAQFIHHAAPRFSKTTADPLNEPLELLERWDRDKVITVIQKCRLIRNERNPFGKIPFYSVNFWDMPNAFWGIGLGRSIGQDQRVSTGLINALLDITSLIVNPMYVQSNSANVTSQNTRLRPGGWIRVEGEAGKAFSLLEQPRFPVEVFQEIASAEARAEQTSGANELLVQGAMPATGRTSMGRSATGAGALNAAAANRIQALVENFVAQVYEPFLYEMHELNRERLPFSVLRDILGKKLGQQYKVKPVDYCNAEFEFDVLAGSHLAARSQMAQSLAIMVQIFDSPITMQKLAEVNQKYVDVDELMHMVHDMSGFKNYYDVIKDMTPEMIQRQKAAAQAPAQAQLQAKMALEDKKFQNQQTLLDEGNLAKAGRDVLRKGVEKSADQETVTGQPGGPGFGSSLIA